MKQAHGSWVQISAPPFQVIPTETVLVPPVFHPLNIAGEYQKKRRQRSQLVNPDPLLNPHPVLQFLRVSPFSPLPQIYHHHPRVKITRPPPLKGGRKSRVRPEFRSEVVGEVGVAVLGSTQDMCTQVDTPQLRHVIYYDEIGIEVDNATNGGGQEIGEVDPGIVQWLIESSAYGGGDLALDEVGIEEVKMEVEVREGSGNDTTQLWATALGSDEMEHNILGTRSVLENGKHAGDGASKIDGVECHGYVDD